MPFKTKNRLNMNWWGIDRKVGQGLANTGPDVMLVQTLLNGIQRREHDGGVFIAWRIPPPSQPLEIDGFCGPVTTKWIVWFQQVNALFVDGVVDPVFPPVDDPVIGGDRRGTISGKIYAISQLNRIFGLAQPVWNSRFDVDRRTHPVLRTALRGQVRP
jgi:hypothetical protein